MSSVERVKIMSVNLEKVDFEEKIPKENISSRYSNNSEASASELLENLEIEFDIKIPSLESVNH